MFYCLWTTVHVFVSSVSEIKVYTLDRVFETSRHFGFSTRNLGHVMFPSRELLRKQELVVDRGQLVSLFTVH